jgi:guanylate kinase
MADTRPRMLIVSGPSCAGKSPLCDAARKARPDLFEGLEELVLYHSRARRAHEREGEDYFFRPKEEIAHKRREEGVKVWEVRDDLQALELAQLDEKLERGGALYEGNFRIALDLKERVGERALAIFVAPLTAGEVRAWRREKGATFEERLTEMMRRRLLRRTHFQQEYLGLPDLESIESRARDAIHGLRQAHRFDHVIPNHDGEDSDHWRLAEAPIGDARLAVEAVCAAMAGDAHERLERWDDDLVPDAGPSAEG